MVDPKFLLDIQLFNPDRMQIKGVEAYWNHWVSLAQAGSPFSFLSFGKGKGSEHTVGAGKKVDGDKGEEGADDEGGPRDDDEGEPREEEEESDKSLTDPLVFAIDEGIPVPCQCKTHAERTACLQDLVPRNSKTNRAFIKLVGLVDLWEVSSIPVNQSSSKFVLS